MPAPKKALAAPKLPKKLEAHVLTSIDGADLEQCCLEGCELSEQAGERVRFEGVKLLGGSLRATKLARLSWLDVLGERCDLSMVEWPGAKLTRVEARACRATGAALAEGELDNVRFVECQLDYASFVGARFRQVTFEACRLKEADFSGADLTGTSFLRCDLQGADFTGSKLLGADVSSSTLSQVRLGAGDARGLVVSREQAVVIAQLFGVVLQDE
ncbi:MAG: pentapeptide repeat-containing protein [Polyangiaceae bacterium]|nr:pentapeptide repeat-containing protein [Polyangiaceae bacterium]